MGRCHLWFDISRRIYQICLHLGTALGIDHLSHPFVSVSIVILAPPLLLVLQYSDIDSEAIDTMSTVLVRLEKAAQVDDKSPGAATTDLGVLSSSSSISETPALGVPKEEKRFFFQRTKAYDPDAIATLVCLSSCA